jgi:hypothetical protein
MAITAITTSNSIKLKPFERARREWVAGFIAPAVYQQWSFGAIREE